MSAVKRVLIVGAGMSGMTAGIALKQKGIDCEIVELRQALSEPGTGITLQGPALRALRRVGILDECVKQGFPQSFFKTCDADGNVTGTVNLPNLLGPPYPATVGTLRQSVHEVMAAKLASLGVPVVLGTTVRALTQEADAIDVAFSDGRNERFDIVVGADGSGSVVRTLTFGSDVKPYYTGQMNWRAIVNRPAEVKGRYSYFGRIVKSGFNPISEKEMYIYLLQNVPERPRWADEELPGLLKSLLLEFGGVLGRARDEVSDPAKIICRPVYSMILRPPWHKGRVVLIGDAAHTTTPQLASGATIAIEDAVVLAKHLVSTDVLHTALSAFTADRYERCRMVVKNSEQLGEWEKKPGTFDHLVADLVAATYRELARDV